MSAPNSTPATAPSKPSKPCPDFPLFPHATGRSAKKIRGKVHYFGPWADPDGALTKYLERKGALHTGRKPRPDPAALTVKDVVNAFLNHKQSLVDAGELSRRTWDGYKIATDEFSNRSPSPTVSRYPDVPRPAILLTIPPTSGRASLLSAEDTVPSGKAAARDWHRPGRAAVRPKIDLP